MKLLLTSTGVINSEIINALQSTLDKPLSEVTVFFVPTAINQLEDSRQRLSEYKSQLSDLVKKTHTVDIAKEQKIEWIEKLNNSDLIYVSGGNPYYLLYWVRKSGLSDILSEALQTKAYFGISAGSMILGKQIPIEPKDFSLDYIDKNDPHKALGLVSFNIEPHFGSAEHPDLSDKNLKKMAKDYNPIYALGDQSALLIKDGEITIINEDGVKYYK